MADEYIRKADAVKECGEWYVEEGTEEGFIGTVSQMLDMFSPADVVHVVHARWENYSPITIKCSRCGHVIHDWRYSECKYCPNCGARMDGERKE